jgi:hypothetical protein
MVSPTFYSDNRKKLLELIVLCTEEALLPTSNSQKRLYLLSSEEDSKLRPAYLLLHLS